MSGFSPHRFDQIQHDSGVRALGDAPALVVIDKPAPTLVAPQVRVRPCSVVPSHT